MRFDAIDADEARELAVRVQDHVTMHEHGFVNALAELGEQLRSGLVAGRAARRAQQQLIHGDAECLHVELRLVAGIDLDVLREPVTRHRALHRQRQLGDRPQIAPLEQEQHEQQRRHECEQHADQS
jgi:hypothetical protein